MITRSSCRSCKNSNRGERRGRLFARSRRAILRGVLMGGLCVGTLLSSPLRDGIAAAGSSIQGRVTVLDREGKPKDRHDGVVVFLDELENLPQRDVRPPLAIIRQINKRFVPDTLPILVGTTVDFPNGDTIYHNVFSLSKVKPFDLGLYAQGESQSVTFDQPGLVKVYCNIHSDMVANILVLPNPYFTTSDKEGRFVIADVPLRAATVRGWHPRSRRHPERKVVITAQGIQDLNLLLVEDLRLEIREETLSIKHKNKWGQDYPAQY